ncbi:hypothetical protein [Mycoplasma hafezii]|uniref:hypothetical protein n=1 Tax=Mycoplasma hafezii TaxID=525886 RepID=UPI003CF8748D
MTKELSIIKSAIITNFLHLFFGIIALIALWVGLSLFTYYLAPTPGRIPHGESVGVIIGCVICIFIILAEFVIFMLNLVFTIQAALLKHPTNEIDSSSNKTLIWVGFGLQFVFGLVGSILMLVGLFKQKSLFQDETTQF